MKLRPLDFASDGIYLCGTAHGPKDIVGSLSQAYGAAARASIPLAKGLIVTEGITAEVNSELCGGCGICEEKCPRKVVDDVFEATSQGQGIKANAGTLSTGGNAVAR